MEVADDQGLRDHDAVLIGDKNSGREFPWDARIRTQVLAVGLLTVMVPAGFQIVHVATAWAHWMVQGAAATILGGGVAAAAAVILTRVYSRHDTPATRLDYWAQQAWGLATSPRPPGPPIEHETTPPPFDPDGGLTGAAWEASTPPSLSDTCKH